MAGTGRYQPGNVFMQNTAGASIIVRRTTSFRSLLVSEQRSPDCAIYARIYTAANILWVKKTAKYGPARHFCRRLSLNLRVPSSRLLLLVFLAPGLLKA
jgi:hypothetical protein